jgi:hypothetical protein
MKIPIKANEDKIKEFLMAVCVDRKEKRQIDKLIKYMEMTGFFMAPCSVRHHLAMDGGLAQHVLEVLYFGFHLLQYYYVKIPVSSFIKCALLHDICKSEQYTKQGEKWFYINKQEPPQLHGLRSVEIIEQYIKLTPMEREMILWHMGPYTDYYDGHKPGDFLEWSKSKDDKTKNAALFLYWCDHFSTAFIEAVYEKG